MSRLITGRIIRALSGFYYVDSGTDVIECRARGIMRKNGDTLYVGDTVEITAESSSGSVENVVNRRNFISRPPVANVDRLYIVSSHSNPAPNTYIIDKQICICESKGIEPVIVFNKSDEGDFDELSAVYRNAGYDVYVISCATGEGIDVLRNGLKSGISVFTGNSGVGKSSLLNRLMPQLKLKTGEVSDKLGRGRHTTRHVELYDVGNGCLIADTPGFSTIECEPMLKEEIADLFIEFSDYINECRFTSCTHVCEKGCAVIDAVKRGDISHSRYDSYSAIYREAAQVKSWEIKK